MRSVNKMEKRSDLKYLSLTIVLLLAFGSSRPALCSFDATGWTRYRQVAENSDAHDGYVAIMIDSELMEKCRPDLADLRVSTDDGHVVPVTLVYENDNALPEQLPAKVFALRRYRGNGRTYGWIRARKSSQAN